MNGMSGVLYSEVGETSLPLELVISRLGTGGVPGLTPTVACRNISLGGAPYWYLDWFDNTFKTAAWITKYAPMTNIESGYYQRILNVAALSLPVGTKLNIEFSVTGAGISGIAADTYELTDTNAQVSYLRKVAKNRMWEASGLPGSLTLYDDDGVTPLTTWTLNDETGGAVLPAVGTPARRGAGTP